MTAVKLGRITNLNRMLKDAGPLQPCTSLDARQAWQSWRLENGYAPGAPFLTVASGNAKLQKSEIPTVGLSLSPSTESGRFNTCTWSTPECRKACLRTAGRNAMPAAQGGQQLRTLFVAKYPQEAATLIWDEVGFHWRKHGPLRVRLNLLSDIEWELVAPFIFDVPDDVKFYDYTKNWKRASQQSHELPLNYRLLMSASDKFNNERVQIALQMGVSVAMVFDHVPETYLDVPVIDGDAHDDRWIEPPGSLIGLTAKGKARKLEPRRTGFVRRA